MKSFQTVKRTVLTMVAMLFFALVVVGDIERVEADDIIEISVGIEKGSSPTYGKTSNQSVSRSGSWITLYQPNNYNFRIDYSANTTGSIRTGYVYVKEGTKTVKTYKITQSASVTVTYDKNGAGSSFTRSVTYGKSYGKVDKPTRTGYEFTGWYTAKTGGSQVTETTLMKKTENHTLYAHWEPKKYTVTFKNGTTTVSTKTVTYGNTYEELPGCTKTGYDLAGWFTSSSGGSQVTASTKVTITSNQTLYTHWTPKKITVSFDTDGGSSVTPKTVKYNDYYTLPSKPTKTGYTFDGWYTAASGGTKITSSTKVTASEDHTVYAHWTANKYTVTFDKNGGSGANFTRTIAYGSTYTKVDKPARTGYDFIGWYTAKTGGNQVTETTKMTTASNHTVYARWSPKTFTVYFNSNGGSSVSSKKVTYDGYYESLTTPTRKNYTFLGWYTAKSGGTLVTASTKVTITSSQTLYAQWEGDKYTVTFDKNGGDGDNYIRSIAYGNTYTKVDKPTRTGYDFIGWYTARTGGSQVTETTTMSTAEDHTVYAQWTAKQYTVTLNDNYYHSDIGIIVKKTVTYDSTYGELTAPTREYYKFDGWYTAATGGTKVTASTKVTNAADHTLYAHWTANNYSVTYDKNGGNGDNFIRSIAYGSTYVKVDIPTRTGYSFAGWYTEKTGGSQVTETTIMSTAANHTLYAHWTANKYTITYDKNGGNGDNFTRSIAYGSTYAKVDIPTRTGYTFSGWYTAKTGGSQVTDTTIMSNAENHTLYAHWTPNTCKVTYDKNGGNGRNITRSIAYGSTYGKVDVPIRTGYDFLGWYTEKSGGKQVVETTIMTATEDHTLYAHWAPKIIEVTFVSVVDDHMIIELVLDTKLVTYGNSYGKLFVPTRSGYIFQGWYTVPMGNDVSKPVRITETSKVTNQADHTLYAYWTPDMYTVTYDLNGGEGENFARKISYNANYGKVDDPKKTGYSFVGWYTEKTGGSQVTETTIMLTAESHTLYAHWKASSPCGVILDPQNGDANMTVSVIQGETYGDALPTVKKTGYNFKGWYTAKSGGTKITSASIVPYSTVVQLYAQWSVKTYTVKFDANGGTGGPTSMKKTYGKAATIPADEPNLSGYEFLGWADSLADAKEKKISCYPGGYFTRNKNMTLYAVWGYANMVCSDGNIMSIYVGADYVDQLVQEAKNWPGINDTKDYTPTDGYPMLEQIRNALYFGSSGCRLRNVCQALNSSVKQNDMSELKYLEITIHKSSDIVAISEVYTNDVMQNNKKGEWFNLNAFSDTLPSYQKTELSQVLRVVSDGMREGLYFANQGDYENEAFMSELRLIVEEGMKNIVSQKIMGSTNIEDWMKIFSDGICGPMAAVNLYFYLSDDDKTVKKEDVWNELEAYFRMENGPVAWLERKKSKGDGWESICDYLNNRLDLHGKKASAGLEGIQGSTETQFVKTKGMISEETPVLMSFHSENERLMMYKLEGNTLKKSNSCSSHYVLVTGIYESARGESVYLKVASWGEEFYINWNEYVAKANKGLYGNVGSGYITFETVIAAIL